MELVLRFLDRKQEAVHRKHWGECSFATPSQSVGVREEKKENKLINSYDCQAITVSSNVKWTKKRDACAKWLFLLPFSWRRCRHCFLIGSLNDNDDDGSQNITKKMNLRRFKLYRVYLEPLNSSNVGDFFRRTSTSSAKRRIGRFHVAVRQWTLVLLIKPIVFWRCRRRSRDLKIRGRRRQRKRRWKSEFVFFQSSSRLLQVTNFFKCRRTILKLNS